MKKISLQLFPWGNDGLDDGLERVYISTQTDHLEIETEQDRFLKRAHKHS